MKNASVSQVKQVTPNLPAQKLAKARSDAIIAISKHQRLKNKTITKQASISENKAIKLVILNHLPALQTEWLSVAAECTNTATAKKVLKERLDDVLNLMAKAIKETKNAKLPQQVYRAIIPIQRYRVSQWAAQKRVLSSNSNIPGKWYNQNAPHLEEIMDSLSVHSPARTITFMKSSGVGGTEILLNWLGYILEHVQHNVMLVVPTLELRDRTFYPLIQQLIQDTPSLHQMSVMKAKNNKESKGVIQMNGIKLVLSGANSASSLRGEHLRYAIIDELDGCPSNVGGEGDIITLVENRQKTYPGSAKGFYLSTPVEQGSSKIQELYLRGDQRRRFVPCPKCNKPQELKFENFKFERNEEKTEVTDAYFVCVGCGHQIRESEKDEMLTAGVWIAQNPNSGKHVSFFIHAFYTKTGMGESWLDIAQKWCNAQGDSLKLISFVNTYLGETNEIESDGVEASPLLERAEEFPDVIPNTLRVMGVDVQKDRLEASIYDFKASKECWGQTHLIISGDPLEAQTWQNLTDEINKWNVRLVGIDANYSKDIVHEYCKNKPWVVCFIGRSGNVPLVPTALQLKQNLRKRTRGEVKSLMLGVDHGKAWLMSRLKLTAPTNGEAKEGYIHFKNCLEFDHEFFEQLTAEKLFTEKSRGKTITAWKATRARNEALDCYVLALAIFTLRGTQAMARQIQEKVNPTNPVRKQR